MENSGSNAGKLLLALLGGAALGAGVALLYAPQSGRRTRQRLRDLGEDVSDGARDLFKKAEDSLDMARNSLEEAKLRGEAWLRLHKGHGCEFDKSSEG